MRTVVVWLLLVASASAQTKPIGAFSADGAPAWMSFGWICGDCQNDAQVAAAVARSRATGFLWVVQMGYHAHPVRPAEEVGAEVRARLERLGLWPYVAAVNYQEEVYEQWRGGVFTPFGLPPDHPHGVPVLHAWWGRQHTHLRAVTARPIVWITHTVYQQPVPQSTDFVALDPYLRDGEPFSTIEPFLLHAETATSLPLVLIPRWFRSVGPAQGPGWEGGSAPPSAEAIDGYARILARPRWFAMAGFLWQSRPWADLVGLADMPDTLAAVERSLKVQ